MILYQPNREYFRCCRKTYSI